MWSLAAPVTDRRKGARISGLIDMPACHPDPMMERVF
jgi:hypothetical protein